MGKDWKKDIFVLQPKNPLLSSYNGVFHISTTKLRVNSNAYISDYFLFKLLFR